MRILPVLLAALALLTAAAAPPAALAQVPTLSRVDSLVVAGQYADARTTLGRWWSARDQFDVPGSDMARALMLRARLASDPDDAEPDYLAVVLGYPTSTHAPEALLRLGQGLLATGDAARSAAYLERLVADYPGRPQRLPGLLWLARAQTAARRPAAACNAARSGLQDARDPDLAAMLRAEVETACALAAADPAPGDAAAAGAVAGRADRPADRTDRPAATPQPRPVTPEARPAPRDMETGPVTAAGDWSVQTGAFRYRASADALMERLREAGHSPRLVLVPRNDLLRVRIGRFPSQDDAVRLVNRLRSQGFEALPVRDAAEERRP